MKIQHRFLMLMFFLPVHLSLAEDAAKTARKPEDWRAGMPEEVRNKLEPIPKPEVMPIIPKAGSTQNPGFGIASITSDNGKLLNIAILELPPKYIAGIPHDKRGEFLGNLSYYPHDHRLDYGNGYMHYESDNAEENSWIGVECRFYMKLLPDLDSPAVFVFMDRNYSGCETPSASDATVLRREDGKWIDITDKVLPPGIERNRYIMPFRDSLNFEVRKRDIRTTKDGSQYYYAGALEAIIRWNGRKFEKVPSTEQADAGQPATRPESKPEGSDKLQPEAEGRSR